MLVELVARPHCNMNDAIKYVYTILDLWKRLLRINSFLLIVAVGFIAVTIISYRLSTNLLESLIKFCTAKKSIELCWLLMLASPIGSLSMLRNSCMLH